MACRSAVRHFERLAPAYPRLRRRWPLSWLRIQEERALRHLVSPQPGARVLDAGCGDGTTLAWLTEQGARAVGIDIAWRMAVQCRRRGFVICRQDIEHIAFQPRFDWVLCIGALEFTMEPEGAIRSLAACVAPTGQLGVLFPRRGWLGLLYAGYHRRHGVRVWLFSRADVTRHLAAAGFRPTGWRDCALSTLCVARRAAPADAPAADAIG